MSKNKYLNKNCACCERRKTCGTWNLDRYGDIGEGKKPFPDNCNCIRFKFDKDYRRLY